MPPPTLGRTVDIRTPDSIVSEHGHADSFRLPLIGIGAATSCTEGPTRPANPPQFKILDAVHNSGNQHFFWLPPVFHAPGEFSGLFDDQLLPLLRVDIRAWSGTTCVGSAVAALLSET